MRVMLRSVNNLPGEDEGSRRAVIVVTLATLHVVVCGKVGGSCSDDYLLRPGASPWRGRV
jgi:hypothetical protein